MGAHRKEVIITLSGGAPWGFRLQGGVEHQKPLQVVKVRRVTQHAGWVAEADELVSINEQPCAMLSHAQAMNLIDSSPGYYTSGSKGQKNKRNEAYYGETDSDADVAGYERQRRQKRRSPSNSNPGKPTGRTSPEARAHVGPVNKPIDDELTTTYMEKAKQAKLNRGDTQQDKQVKEAKSKCRTIASLLTDAPNPHSKGVLMFKKRRQRSKKYTLTSFGRWVLPGSESEFDEEGFSSVPDPTWDSDYLDMLEKRATAGTEGRGDGAEDLFEQQRKRVAEHAKKAEAESSPPVAPKPATASVTILTSPGQPAETPLPELPVSNVLNRTARPFTPGFISIRRPASTAVVSLVSKPEAPVTYHPPSLSTCVQSTPPITTVQQAPFPIVTPASIPSVPPAPHVPVILVPGPPTSQIPVSADQVITVAQESCEARRRNGKPKPMFNVPDVKKKSPNPELLSMVQNLDDRSSRHNYGKVPPPVHPNHELFTKLHRFSKQSRMGMYVVDTPPETTYQKEGTMHSAAQPLGSSLNPSLPSQWKYSQMSVHRPQLGTTHFWPHLSLLGLREKQTSQTTGTGFHEKATLSAQFCHRDYIPPMVGSSLTSPRQIPVKTARVYEVKRFSTPTPMSGPSLAPKVLAPRSATCLGERLTHSGMTSPPPETFTPTPVSALTTAPDSIPTPAAPLSQPTGPPNLPKFLPLPFQTQCPLQSQHLMLQCHIPLGSSQPNSFRVLLSSASLPLCLHSSPTQYRHLNHDCGHQGRCSAPCLEARAIWAMKQSVPCLDIFIFMKRLINHGQKYI
uniref:Synaptopodin 2 like n=1 Tax=Maylandia zebra TaxID=106582 RepID=A0A3P9DJW5_9CICH